MEKAKRIECTVYETRQAMNAACDDWLDIATRIDIMAFGLKSFRKTQQAQVERILAEGGNIRIITLMPGCDALFLREEEEHATKYSLTYEILDMIAWAQDTNAKGFRGKIQVRCYDHLPQEFLFLIDSRVFVGPYEYGKDSQQCLSFEYDAESRMYEYYQNRFEELWNDPEFCVDALDKEQSSQATAR